MKLAGAAYLVYLGVSLLRTRRAGIPAHATPLMTSPDGKCELRILGPIELAGRFEWYQLTVQPGGTLDSHAHEPGSREHLTVHGGTLEVQRNIIARRLLDLGSDD